MTLNGQIPSRQADAVAVMHSCSAFASSGWDIRLVIPKGAAEPLEELGPAKDIWDLYGIKDKFDVTYLPMKGLRRPFGSYIYSLWAMSYATLISRRLIYARNPELAYMAALYRRGVVYESHEFLSRPSRTMRRWLRIVKGSRRGIGIVATTKGAAGLYQELGVPSNKLMIAPNGVDTTRFEEPRDVGALRSSLGLPNSGSIIGFAGHLYPGRGIEELLECAQTLPHAYFLIVGGEDLDIKRASDFAVKLGVSNVRFQGFVPQSQVANYLLASDILVMPYTSKTRTINDMSPMKMFDYLATGRPIVATNFPMIAEVLRHEYNAILVEPDSGPALANGIKRLIDNPRLAEHIGSNARTDAEYYSWKNRAKRITTWYQELSG